MPTEEGTILYYEKEYYICYFDNHECLKGTGQERELYKPFKCTFHKGSRPNLYGAKVFEKIENAQKWCDSNAP